MKISSTLLLILSLFFIASCQQSGDQQDGHAEKQPGANQELYDEVMSIHDEVMPKMNDLHKKKTALRTRLEMPGLPEQEKQEIENEISRLDSASEGMMVWMRQFDPLPDSAGEDKARAYLEAELKKVKQVREDILEALQSAP